MRVTHSASHRGWEVIYTIHGWWSPERLRTWWTAGADPNHVMNKQKALYTLFLSQCHPCFVPKNLAHTYAESLEWFLPLIFCYLIVNLKKELGWGGSFSSRHLFFFANLSCCPQWSHIQHPSRYSWIMWRDPFDDSLIFPCTRPTGLQFFTNVIAF